MSTTTYELDTKWQDTDGKNFSKTFKYHNSESTDAQVKTFAQAYITNGSMFKRVPTQCISATKVQITETPYDLS